MYHDNDDNFLIQKGGTSTGQNKKVNLGTLNSNIKNNEYRTITTNEVLTTADDIIYIDTTSGEITLTLPTLLSSNKKEFEIKKITSDNNNLF